MASIAQAGIPWLARLTPEPEPKPAPRRWIPYEIPLRYGERGPHNHARLVLPMDLSVEEASRLCAVIRALAFTDGELLGKETSDA